jgi:hypothetical protein
MLRFLLSVHEQYFLGCVPYVYFNQVLHAEEKFGGNQKRSG